MTFKDFEMKHIGTLIFLLFGMYSYANAKTNKNPMIQFHSVSRTATHLFEVVNTVYDNKTLAMEIRRYEKVNRNFYHVISKLNIRILDDEMQNITRHLVFLADAPITHKNRIQKCTIQPNDPTSRYMATVRDFDPLTRKFYGKMTTVDNDSKCWQSEVIQYSSKEDRKIASDLKEIINKIAYLATETHISNKPR